MLHRKRCIGLSVVMFMYCTFISYIVPGLYVRLPHSSMPVLRVTYWLSVLAYVRIYSKQQYSNVHDHQYNCHIAMCTNVTVGAQALCMNG